MLLSRRDKKHGHGRNSVFVSRFHHTGQRFFTFLAFLLLENKTNININNELFAQIRIGIQAIPYTTPTSTKLQPTFLWFIMMVTKLIDQI